MFVGCDDSCTGLLLDKVYDLEAILADNTGHVISGELGPPWEKLLRLEHSASEQQLILKQLQSASDLLRNLIPNIEEDINKKAKQLFNKVGHTKSSFFLNNYYEQKNPKHYKFLLCIIY